MEIRMFKPSATPKFAAITLGLLLPLLAQAQLGGGGAAAGGSGATGSGPAMSAGQGGNGTSSRQADSSLQRAPLNEGRSPVNADRVPSNAERNETKAQPTEQTQRLPGPGGGGAPRAESGLSEEQIRKDCTMAAAPDDCRVRARQGLTDDSIERDLP
jgi:hypothetical protein